MPLKTFLILRSDRRERLEGRTTAMQLSFDAVRDGNKGIVA